MEKRKKMDGEEEEIEVKRGKEIEREEKRDGKRWRYIGKERGGEKGKETSGKRKRQGGKGERVGERKKEIETR